MLGKRKGGVIQPPTKRTKYDETNNFFQSMEGLISKPEEFAVQSDQLQHQILEILQVLYQYEKQTEPRKFSPLPSLITKDMDIDQIWEQIQLCNKPLIKYVNELPLEEEKRKHIDQDSEEEEEENELESDQDSDLSDDDDLGNDPIDMESNQQNINEEKDSENDSEEEDDEEREEKLEDDPFFDYDEMEAFIEDGERRAELGSEADDEEFLEYLNKSNLDQENSDDDEMNDEEDSEDSEDGGIDWEKMKEGKEIEKITDIRYDDFFEPPKLSKHQQNKEKLGKKIQELEDINIADKPWQLQGEISSKQRPKDSLLEEFVIFDHATKTAPVITVEKTHDLEDIIKQRIRDESWDDVIPRRISNDLHDNKKKLDELDHEKSKHGLAEVYERQYLGLDAEEAEQKAKEKYDEITTLFNSLSYKLDALSNFNFTPNRKKKSTDEKKKDVPAINLEEKLPSTVSDASLLAPEEVYAPKKKPLKGETELTSEEKKANRRAKKTAKRKQKKADEADKKVIEKLNPGLGNKYTKQAAIDNLNQLRKAKNVQFAGNSNTSDINYTQSTAFFSKLQQDAQSTINSVKDQSKKKQKEAKSQGAQSFKL